MEENRRRKHLVKCRLDDQEFENFSSKVEKSKLSKEEFIRSAIFKIKIMEPPSLDFYALKTEINRIGNNLNQLCKLANSGLAIDVNLINESLKELNQFLKTATGGN